MIPANTQKTRLEKFRDGDGPGRLAALLKDPVMVEALAIIEEKTEPNDSILTGLVRDYKAEAPMVISMIHAGQAGIRRTLRLLKALAFRPQADNQHMDAFTLEAYSHIDEKYLEQTHQ
jgi:hypothetical protein